MARKQSPHTATFIARLSKLFRFILYQSGQKEITLREETDIIRHYIELEKLRYDDSLCLQYEEEIDDYQQRMGPLLLLPLVENAFKHGAGESIDQPYIHLRLELRQQVLTMEVINSVEERYAVAEQGIGLANLRRQLELQYPQRHQLDVERAVRQHRVRLKIQFV